MSQDVPPEKTLDATLLVRRMGHDFNNLFSIVLGGLSLLQRRQRRSMVAAEVAA